MSILPSERISGQERRSVILQSAMKLFSERGFRGATTRELAAAAGVSEPVLYQHFKTKRDLFTAIIEWKIESSLELVAGLLDSSRTITDDREFFARLALVILEWYERDPAYVRLLLHSGLEGHELSEIFFDKQRCAFHDMVAGYIGERISQGVFRPVDPKAAADAFIGMIAHQGLASLLFKAHYDRGQLAGVAVAIFLDGMRTQS
ncbi:MAG: TetR/AcrR family transcriptional regulator [Acidobacteria bacterium]|nr:TetR/AcrR family transcriptional regulator [Acidobacteriota bacterium]